MGLSHLVLLSPRFPPEIGHDEIYSLYSEPIWTLQRSHVQAMLLILGFRNSAGWWSSFSFYLLEGRSSGGWFAQGILLYSTWRAAHRLRCLNYRTANSAALFSPAAWWWHQQEANQFPGLERSFQVWKNCLLRCARRRYLESSNLLKFALGS